MSAAFANCSRRERKSCRSCRERRARYRYRGRVRADRHHTLCFECFRRERERLRARGFVRERTESPGVPRSLPWQPTEREPLTERQRSHRGVMLAHLTQQAPARQRTMR
jgi:hypothetical protein